MAAPIRPGNSERGWNDPPVFSFESQNAPVAESTSLSDSRAPTRGRLKLNKRVAHPGIAGPRDPRNPPKASATDVSLTGPPVGNPPLSEPPKLQAVLATDESDKTLSDHPEEFKQTPEETIQIFRNLLGKCEPQLQKRVFDDVSRKFLTMEEMLRRGQLSQPVREGLSVIADSLNEGEWSKAFDTHTKLIVDYSSEVSQWMVAIKKLITVLKTSQ